MGSVFFFSDEEIPVRINNKRGEIGCIEVVDCGGTPEIRIGPVGASFQGWTAEFQDWNQFERFVDAVNRLHSRLHGIK